jgi:glycosyltransferase involved in cell wall biosynthesis
MIPISILIPLYNGVEFLDESVSSVLEQTYESWELIIGVNGHPENSEVYKTAQKYSNHEKIRVLDFHTTRGKSNVLNEMILHCTYDYVAILDVDDIWMPTKLEIQSQVLNKYNYDVVGSKCMYFGDIENIIPSIPIGDISAFDFTLVNPVINSSAILRKSLCEWNACWDGVEDYDLWLRLRKQNRRFFNCEHVLVKHRIHTSSAFNSKGNSNQVPELLAHHY